MPKPRRKPWPHDPNQIASGNPGAVHRFGLFVRSIGMARARTKIGLANLAYNLKRFLWIDGRLALQLRFCAWCLSAGFPGLRGSSPPFGV